jgi:hypothetical protein
LAWRNAEEMLSLLDGWDKQLDHDPPFVATRTGAASRHIAFHPELPLAYVINELGSSVTTYRFDPQRRSLQPIHPSIPPNYTGNNTGAEIAVAPTGHLVYASNRGREWKIISEAVKASAAYARRGNLPSVAVGDLDRRLGRPRSCRTDGERRSSPTRRVFMTRRHRHFTFGTSLLNASQRS